MVKEMDRINYIEIKKDNLLENVRFIKNNYKYDNYIFDVSNNAFFHGMYLINYLKDITNYLYVNNFDDLRLIRKYDENILVIYNGEVRESNVYDLIMNNAIVVIHDIDTLKKIKELKIKDELKILFYIDPQGFYGINKRQDILDFLEDDYKYFKLWGIMANIQEKDYEEFKYIIKPLTNLKLMILNHENDKRKIHNSNALLLDYSLYGINGDKKGIFLKKEKPLKQVFIFHSKVINIKEEKHNKKEKYIAVVPLGEYQGMRKEIKKVWINKRSYAVFKVMKDATYIIVDKDVKKDMNVEITSENNPLENYFDDTINYFGLFNLNMPIVYDNYVLEKTLIY